MQRRKDASLRKLKTQVENTEGIGSYRVQRKGFCRFKEQWTSNDGVTMFSKKMME
jgi:hypothetical protein